METDDAVTKSEPTTQAATPVQTTVSKNKSSAILLPEVDLYIHLLVLLFAIDRQKNKQVKKSK